MMNKFLLFLFFSYSSCLYSGLPKDEKIAYNVIGRFSKFANKKYGFETGGVGVRGPKDRVDGFTILLQTAEPLTIESGRKLMVEMALDFLKAINSREDLRPYLVEYPFKMSSISISFHTLIPLQGNVQLPNIRSVALISNEIHYRDDGNEWPTLGCIHKETFEEALALISPSKPAKQ